MPTNIRDRDIANLLYLPERDQATSRENCFLCGVKVDAEAQGEHVFPKWLQHRFQLWDHRLTLLNGTEIPYRYLTIPCCLTCNNEDLASNENRVKAAVEGGISTFKDLDAPWLYLWLSKIYYGILFKELFLVADRRNPELGTIVDPGFFEYLETTHIFLQSLRFASAFQGTPWSIFRFECHDYEEIEKNFDFLDSLGGKSLGLRMGSVGVIACLQDNNATEFYSEEFIQPFQNQKLHPIQFRELMAYVVYKQRLLKWKTAYSTALPSVDGAPIFNLVEPPTESESANPYDEWDQAEYAWVLSTYTHIERDMIFREPDQTMSWLFNPDGSVRYMGAVEGEEAQA